jgi:acyl-CoA dehydrogenase
MHVPIAPPSAASPAHGVASSPSSPASQRVDEAETLALLRGSVTKLARHIDSQRIDREGAIPERVLEIAREAGLFAMSIPAEYGGFGLSLGGTCSLVSEIARIDRSVAVMIGLHAGLGTMGLLRYGSEAQRARWLPSLASGECIAAFAATEPGAGSDLMAIETTATCVPEGLRLHGRKCYVTNGAFAGLYTLLVRTPNLGGAKAQSLVCVARDTPGLQIGAEEDKLGIRGSSAVTLDLDDVVVGLDAVLGAPGGGSAQAHHVLAWGRTLMSAGCVGIAQRALELTLAHVTTRKQFGRTLAAQPLVAAECADLAARTYAMEALVAMTADAEHDAATLERVSVLTKVFCSETAYHLADRAIQLHGALGFLEPTGLPRLLRDCRITRIFEGANDVLLIRTGAAMLATRRTAAHRPLAPELQPPLRVLGVAWDAASAALHDALAELDTRHGITVIRQQSRLWSLGQAAVQLEAARASLLRAQQEASARALALATQATPALLAEARRHLVAALAAPNAEAEAHTLALARALFSQASQA